LQSLITEAWELSCPLAPPLVCAASAARMFAGGDELACEYRYVVPLGGFAVPPALRPNDAATRLFAGALTDGACAVLESRVAVPLLAATGVVRSAPR
jgi:hypothetical protein